MHESLAIYEVNISSTERELELDTVVSGCEKSKGFLATFVERQTRFYVAVKIENRSAQKCTEQFMSYISIFPKKPLKHIPLIEEKSLPVIRK